MRSKVAHVTVASCLLGSGLLFVASAWDEVDCVAGEFTSSGPCGIGIVAGGSLVVVGIVLMIIGAIVLYRGVRRPVSEDAGDGWRVGQAVVVMACGALLALMIPRLRCPPGTVLSPVFRFCVNQQVSYPAPSPGLKWKFLALGVGIAVGIVMIRWRSMPIWLATVIVAAACIGTALFTVARTTGIPGFRHYAPAVVVIAPALFVPVPLRRGARRRLARRS
ncbi:MAG TPA: hypothetical protein VJ736_03020 [Actinomycetota bacterium]|nr:hypothetical protein [Actinomycetota bacterium]